MGDIVIGIAMSTMVGGGICETTRALSFLVRSMLITICAMRLFISRKCWSCWLRVIASVSAVTSPAGSKMACWATGEAGGGAEDCARSCRRVTLSLVSKRLISLSAVITNLFPCTVGPLVGQAWVLRRAGHGKRWPHVEIDVIVSLHGPVPAAVLEMVHETGIDELLDFRGAGTNLQVTQILRHPVGREAQVFVQLPQRQVQARTWLYVGLGRWSLRVAQFTHLAAVRPLHVRTVLTIICTILASV